MNDQHLLRFEKHNFALWWCDLVFLYVPSFFHWFTVGYFSLSYSFTHSLFQYFTESLIQRLIQRKKVFLLYSFTHLLFIISPVQYIQSCIHSFIHTFIHINYYTISLINLLNQQVTQHLNRWFFFMHSLFHIFTHSLIHSPSHPCLHQSSPGTLSLMRSSRAARGPCRSTSSLGCPGTA